MSEREEKKKKTYTAEAIVVVVILWLLNVVSSSDIGVTVVLVGFVGDKVDLAQELLLVMLEFAHHGEMWESRLLLLAGKKAKYLLVLQIDKI